jgi:hypothetical protein
MKAIDLNPKVRRVSPLFWVFESLEEDPGFMTRKFFMADAAYVDGLLCLAVTQGDEPWNGLLVCTLQAFHPSLLEDFPSLVVHPVIGKWLYLSQNDPEFETVALKIARTVRARDSRIGVEPGTRKRSKPGSGPGRKASTKAAAKKTAEPAKKPATKSVAKPAKTAPTKPAEKKVTKTATKSGTKAATKAVAKQATKSATKPAAKPARKAATKSSTKKTKRAVDET